MCNRDGFFFLLITLVGSVSFSPNETTIAKTPLGYGPDRNLFRFVLVETEGEDTCEENVHTHPQTTLALSNLPLPGPMPFGNDSNTNEPNDRNNSNDPDNPNNPNDPNNPDEINPITLIPLITLMSPINVSNITARIDTSFVNSLTTTTTTGTVDVAAGTGAARGIMPTGSFAFPADTGISIGSKDASSSMSKVTAPSIGLAGPSLPPM